ncbi:MAG: DUF3800 domain-containing protein [Armatimonadota bacterium]
MYLDESGDLGFDFVNKNPSRYFTITILVVKGNENNRFLIKAAIKTLRRKLNPKSKRKRIVEELKATKIRADIKKYFYNQMENLNFEIYSITLNKRRVYDYLVKDKARIYNFIAKQVLDKIPFEEAGANIELILDKSKNKKEIIDFNNYVWNQLKARINPKIPLYIRHYDSQQCKGLQAVDLFCWGIFEKYERRKSDWFEVFKEKVKFDEVYLP